MAGLIISIIGLAIIIKLNLNEIPKYKTKFWKK